MALITIPTELQKLNSEFYHNASEDYKKEMADDFCIWLDHNSYKLNGFDPIAFYNDSSTIDTQTCYDFCREFENKIEITNNTI